MATMTADETATATERLLHAIGAGEFGDDIFAPDVTLDATVPGWRFPLQGAAAVREQYASWFVHPGRLEEVVRSDVADGTVLCFTRTWEDNGVPFASRQAHILEIDRAADRICRVLSWCGGGWDASRLAEMEAAAQRSGHAG